jgi:fatty acid synthase subunit beta
MKAKGLVPDDRFFAGHSLGEYAALASVGNVLSVESLCELVFIRGITMQNAVPRDDQVCYQ